MFALLLLALGCTSPAPSPAPVAPSPSAAPAAPAAQIPKAPKLSSERLDLAVAVANAIKAAPSTSEAVLAEHGLSSEELDVLLYEVALDPDASALYAERTQ